MSGESLLYEKQFDPDVDFAYCPTCGSRVWAIRYRVEEATWTGSPQYAEQGPDRMTGFVLVPCMHAVDSWAYTVAEMDAELHARRRDWTFTVDAR